MKPNDGKPSESPTREDRVLHVTDLRQALGGDVDDAFPRCPAAVSMHVKLIPKLANDEWIPCGYKELPGHLPHVWIAPDLLEQIISGKGQAMSRSKQLLDKLARCPGYSPCEPDKRKEPWVPREWLRDVPNGFNQIRTALSRNHASTIPLDETLQSLRAGIIFPARRDIISTATPTLIGQPETRGNSITSEAPSLADAIAKHLVNIGTLPRDLAMIRALDRIFSLNPTQTGIAGAFIAITVMDVSEIRLDRGSKVDIIRGIELRKDIPSRVTPGTDPTSGEGTA